MLDTAEYIIIFFGIRVFKIIHMCVYRHIYIFRRGYNFVKYYDL